MLYLQTVAPDTLELLKELFSRSEIERAKTTHSLLPVHEGGNCYLSLYGVLLNPRLLSLPANLFRGLENRFLNHAVVPNHFTRVGLIA